MLRLFLVFFLVNFHIFANNFETNFQATVAAEPSVMLENCINLMTGQLYINKGGYIFMGLYIGVVSYLIHACFENLFYNIISNWIFGLMLGLMVTWQSDAQGDGIG